MALETYNKKRHFNDTPEPEGKAVKDGKELIFVVQRHEASHLHYDFRLELNGVLLSWAVPKGPSLNPADKRLAVHVEDHPVSYAKWQGDIPEGNYGAGHVDIWDNGTYQPLTDRGDAMSPETFTASFEKGAIRFKLAGKKLNGTFTLRKMGRGEKNWLLIKSRDAHAIDEDYDIESLPHTVSARAAKAVKKKHLNGTIA